MLKSSWSRFLALLVILLAIVTYYFTRNYERSPILRISTGNVQGFVATSRSGRRFFQFLGIPFAQPPVGKLRFESPQPAKNWNGTLDATKHGAECKGFDFFFTGRIQGEESCLFLNVLTPEGTLSQPRGSKKLLLPVIVHVHGGGFHMASTQKYDGKYFMDHDIVLVTIQYRLGIFGFLNTHDGIIKGNMGLKDQVLALKWVQKNVEQFGGDPNQVTLMGESAGGASVSLLMLSPMAEGLFHRAVSMGIVGNSDLWQLSHDGKMHNRLIAEHFNCSTHPQEFAECMRGQTDDTLASYHALAMSLGPQIYNNSALFGPTIERFPGPDALITEHPTELLKSGRIASKVPWIVGLNQNEGLLLVGMLLRFFESHEILDSKVWSDVLPNLLFYNPEERPDAAEKIKRRYFGADSEISQLNEFEIIKNLSSLVTEKMFQKSVVETARLYSKFAPVYMYLYTYQGFLSVFNFLRWASPSSIFSGELTLGLKFVRHLIYKYVLGITQHTYGAAHGDDILLMFQLPMSKEQVVNLVDLEMSQLLIKTYVDFAKSKTSVQFQGLEWPALNPSEDRIQCMELNTGKPEILKDPFKDRLTFWQGLNLPPT